MSMDILKHSVDNRKRSLDRRRETSRHAARDRRGKEADIFTDLKDVVPVVEESTVTHVDRIALLRVAATLCRLRKHVDKLFDQRKSNLKDEEVSTENAISESLDGFMLIVDSDGTVLYATESVSIYLGLTQTDLIGRNLKDFVHPEDYNAITKQMSTDKSAEILESGRNMAIRMKSVISPRGRNLNLKSAIYRTIFGRCRTMLVESQKVSVIFASSTPAGQGNIGSVMGATARNNEKVNGTFLTRHTPDMKFTYVSENFIAHRFETKSLLGTSFYELVHPADIQLVVGSMKELFSKGHTRTPYYRLLGVNSSVAWVQTEAMTVNQTMRGQRGLYVLCMHTLLGVQDELESFATPKVCNIEFAAQPVKVKTEIEDISEYLGRQPEFVDCMDFTPLIEPVNADCNSLINLNEYRPATEKRIQLSNVRRGGENSSLNQGNRDTDSPRPAPLSRKSSFDEVLQWLFRDEPESPPPDSTSIRRTDFYPTQNYHDPVRQVNRDVYMGGQAKNPATNLQNSLPPSAIVTESDYNRSAGIFPISGHRRERDTGPTHPGVPPPPSSSRGRAGIGIRAPATASMDDSNQLAHRAPPASSNAGYNSDHRTTSSRSLSIDKPNYATAGNDRTPLGSSGFSPITAGLAEFSILCSPTQPNSCLGAGFVRGGQGQQQQQSTTNWPTRRVSTGASTSPTNATTQASGFTRVIRPGTLSAVSTTVPNAMPNTGAVRPRESRQEPYSNVQSTMFTPNRHNPAQTSTSQQHIQQQRTPSFQLNNQFSQRPNPAVNVNQLQVAENPYVNQQQQRQSPPRSQPNFYHNSQPPQHQNVQNYQNYEDPYPYHDCPDHFESLAPFIAPDELLQLTESIPMDLFPELVSRSEYTHSKDIQQKFVGPTAARPVMNYENSQNNSNEFCQPVSKRPRQDFLNEYNNKSYYLSAQNSNIRPFQIS